MSTSKIRSCKTVARLPCRRWKPCRLNTFSHISDKQLNELYNAIATNKARHVYHLIMNGLQWPNVRHWKVRLFANV